MTGPNRRPLLLLLLLAALLGAAPAAAQAVEVGLSDQQSETWADPRVRALGLRYARLITPWNAAFTEPARVQAWLDAVQAAGLQPHVAFEHLRTDACPGRPCVVPTRGQYRAAVTAFHARWPQVTTFTSWNEANHASQPVATLPEVAAGYWEELRSVCPACTVVAGDVLDDGGYVRWLERFEAAASPTPRLWGLHNYGDVTYDRTTGTDAVLAAVPGELWIEETGGLVTLRNTAGRVTLSTNEARAARAIDLAFEIAAARPRITHMAIYHWKAKPLDRFDAGLVRPDGTTRPSWFALAGHLAPTRAAAATAVGTAPRLRARWSTRKPVQLLLRFTCRATDRRCRGRLAVGLRTRRTRTSSQLAEHLATRTYATTATKGTITLRITVREALRTRARAAALRRLAVRLRPTRPAGAATTVGVALPKPRG